MWELSVQLAQEHEFPTVLTLTKIVEPLSLQTVSQCGHLYINGPPGWKNTRIHISTTLQHGPDLYNYNMDASEETGNTLLHN